MRALSALTRAQLWSPLVFSEGERAARGGHDYFATGRLRPGVSLEQAGEQLSVIAARLEQQYPAAQALKTDVQEALRDGGKGSAVGFGGDRTRGALVSAEIAAAFVLLIGAGLLVKSFAKLQAVDPGQPLYDVRTMRAALDGTVSGRRLNMTLLGVLASLSLVLAAVGVYGVMSYAVSRRTREIGIRMALGAQASNVLRLTIRQGMAPVLVGVAVGLSAALALTRLAESLLFGVSAADPLTYFGVAVLLTAAALAACYLPARRATKIDPLLALHNE